MRMHGNGLLDQCDGMQELIERVVLDRLAVNTDAFVHTLEVRTRVRPDSHTE